MDQKWISGKIITYIHSIIKWVEFSFCNVIINYKIKKIEGDYMQKRTMAILEKFEGCMHTIFQRDFCSLIVYGSYARGDYDENSDIDVMIIVNTPEDKINSYYDRVSDCAFEFMMRYGVDISPVIKNRIHFEYWKSDLP